MINNDYNNVREFKMLRKMIRKQGNCISLDKKEEDAELGELWWEYSFKGVNKIT